MNPLTYISNISGNKTTLESSKTFKSPEVVALFVFAGFYVVARLVELYILPLIPDFFTREIGALFRWGPILVPIIFGLTFYTDKKSYNDKVLKERMMLWTKK